MRTPKTALTRAAMNAVPKLTRNAASVRGFESSAQSFVQPTPAAWMKSTSSGISTMSVR